MVSDRLSVRLPEALQENLEAVVEGSGKSEAEVVREAIEEYCLKCPASQRLRPCQRAGPDWVRQRGARRPQHQSQISRRLGS